MLKTIKADILFDKQCDYDNLHKNEESMRLIKMFELQLNVTSNTDIKIEDMTEASLETAANMYVYLMSCPETLMPWFKFYSNLIKKKSLDEIALTLNRIMKERNIPQHDGLRVVASKIFGKISTVFGFQYKVFQDMAKYTGNYSLTMDKYSNAVGKNLLVL